MCGVQRRFEIAVEFAAVILLGRYWYSCFNQFNAFWTQIIGL
jgi:hypothetical protein